VAAKPQSAACPANRCRCWWPATALAAPPDFILPADDAAHISAALDPILAKDAILCTDAAKAMAAAARALGVAHRPVNLSAGIRVVAGVYHVQNANSYHSRLKDWMRRFKGVATKYLDSYLGWFRTIERSPATDAKSAQWLAMAVTA